MKYTPLLFVSGDKATEYLNKITNFGEHFTVEYILNNLPNEDEWNFKTFDSPPWGNFGILYEAIVENKRYVLSFSFIHNYISLIKIDKEDLC